MARARYEPVTFTAHVQLAGACTTSVCAPVLDCAVTDCPDGPVSLIAGVPVGDEPTGVTNTWNEGPDAGAGVHWNAQPMFQLGAVIVKAGLVQFPVICVGPTSTRAGAAAAVVVDPPAVVVVVPPAAEVVVEPAPAAVVVVDAVDFGIVYAGALEDEEEDEPDPPPNQLPSHIPTKAARPIPTASCHDLQDRFSLMWRSPGEGKGSLVAGPKSGATGAASEPLPEG